MSPDILFVIDPYSRCKIAEKGGLSRIEHIYTVSLHYEIRGRGERGDINSIEELRMQQNFADVTRYSYHDRGP
jgi:hypothetical protein